MSQVANPEFQSEMRDHAAQQKREENAERAKHQTTKMWLESVEEAGAVEISLYEGEDHERTFTFSQPGTATVSEAMELAAESGDDNIAQLPAMLRRICSILGDKCHDPEMDSETFGDLPPGVVEGAFTELVEATMSNIDEDELDHSTRQDLEQFRGE